MVQRLAVAQALREIGLFLRARKSNPFRAKAYEKAARDLESLQAFRRAVRPAA